MKTSKYPWKGGEFMLDEGFQYYRIKLSHLTEAHIQRILELSGVRRYLYNFGIDYCEERRAQGKGVPNFHTFCKVLTEMRNSEEHGWLKKYNVTSERYAFKDLVNAYAKFFGKVNRYPKYKSRKRSKICCVIRDDRFRFKGDNGEYAFIPGVSESLTDLIYIGPHRIPFGPNIGYNNVRIKSDGVDYWLSLSCKLIKPFSLVDPTEADQYFTEGIGVDVGVRTTATLSDGTTFDPPDKEKLNRLARRKHFLASSLGRDRNKRRLLALRTKTKYEDIPKSKNQEKREQKYLKTCIRMRNIVDSHNHKVSKEIANRRPKFVVIESLSVSDMEKKHNGPYMTANIHRASLFQLTEYIAYKCRDIGSEVIYAAPGYKSSQICSRCGNVTKPGPSKTYECPYCGLTIDRDFNAALNLRDYGIQHLYQ